MILGWLPFALATPVLTEAPVTGWAIGGSPYAAVGGTALGVGDLDGDGLDDLLATAPFEDAAGGVDQGAAFVFFGRPDGAAPTPGWTAAPSARTLARFGSGAAAGDVNGDGRPDLLIGAPGAAGDDEGLVYVFLGRVGGPPTEPDRVLAAPRRRCVGFGRHLASGFDLDQDGDDELAITCLEALQGDGNLTGSVHVWSGGPDGPTDPLALTPVRDPLTLESAGFGEYLITAGDLDVDGFPDLLVSAQAAWVAGLHEGRAYLFPGGADGVAALPAWVADPSDQHLSAFGRSGAVGDHDRDGADDLVISAPLYDTPRREGRAWAWRGQAGAPTLTGWVVDPVDGYAEFGNQVAGADLDADGYDDVVLSVETGGADAILVYRGGPGGLQPSPHQEITVSRFQRLHGAGDVNGDGYADLVVFSEDNGATHLGDLALQLGCGGVDEAPGNRADEDCDGLFQCDVDVDGDGAVARRDLPRGSGERCVVGPPDCDDGDPARSPPLPEVSDNAVDEDCDGLLACWTDGDGDGAVAVQEVPPPCPAVPVDAAIDCDDADAGIAPGAAERQHDGVDQDCDGVDLTRVASGVDAGCGCEATAAPSVPLTWLLGLAAWRRRQRVAATRVP